MRQGLPVRLGQLTAGLVLFGFSMALLVRSGLGVMPWDVLHQGLAGRLGWSLGAVIVAVGALVLLLWIPLKERPGIGTLSNTVVIGLSLDASLAVLPEADGWFAGAAMVLAGVLLNALAIAAYVGVHLGAGPRDGLMIGLARRTGWSIRGVRTGLELGVVSIGWLLGGTLGVATVLYALAIGPLVQVLLPLVETSRRPLADQQQPTLAIGPVESSQSSGRLVECATAT